MPPLLKRILVNGLITAALLGGLGFLFAELTAIWMASNAPARVGPVDAGPAAANPVSSSLSTRLPLVMAAWGFGFILVAELALYAWRGHPAPPAAKQPVEAKPDPAEVLLEQLLAEADAALQKESGDGNRESANKIQSPQEGIPDASAAKPQPSGILTPDS